MDIVRRIPKALVVALVLVLLVGAYLLFRPGAETRTATAHFSRAVSIFEDTEVRILGVPGGRVTAVVPEGSTVRVEMEYDAEYPVPADAKAVIITPTLAQPGMVYLAIGIIGATVMPHNLYLHGALVQTRKVGRAPAQLKQAIRWNTFDSVLSLSIAFLVNAAIMVLAANTFFGKQFK